MKIKATYLCLPLLAILFLGSCDTLDCTLNNTVACNYKFYNSEGLPIELVDILTITAEGTDSTLLNRKAKVSTMAIPMSYWQDMDILTFTVQGDGYILQDKVAIKKSNIEHFESPDCPSTMFHQILSVESTHQFIDTILIVSPSVNYDGIENLQIRLRSDD